MHLTRDHLREEVLTQLQEIGEVDILVGIPSYNNADTIEHVVRAVNSGFAKYFPGQRALLVNSDGGSVDGTPDLVRNAAIDDYRLLLTEHPVRPIHKIVTPYHGLPGKGSALGTVFLIARELKARACAVVDADLRSITPQWIECLLGPIWREDFDYVAPLYHRHKYDGTITNSIVYPLTRALYSKRVRQPIGGDFGFSGRLVRHFLTHSVWNTDVARFGIDIWMTTTAITGGFRICQTFLGAKIHNPKDPGVDLSAMLTQVVSSVFRLMEANAAYWRETSGSAPTPLFGFEYAVGLEPVQVNADRMIGNFKSAAGKWSEVWAQMLSPESFSRLSTLAESDGSEFDFRDELWVRIVYELALAWKRDESIRESLLESLVPLYMGRVAGFVRSTIDADSAEVERRLEFLCLEFERQKPFLIEQWDL